MATLHAPLWKVYKTPELEAAAEQRKNRDKAKK